MGCSGQELDAVELLGERVAGEVGWVEARNRRGWELEWAGKGSSPRHAECTLVSWLYLGCWGPFECLAIVFLYGI